MPRIDELADIRFGSVAPVAVYLGSQQVWPAGGPPAPVTYCGPVDTFDGPGYAAHWTLQDGNVAVNAGTSRHEFIADWSEIGTDPDYTLDESEVLVEVIPDAPTGGLLQTIYLYVISGDESVYVAMQVSAGFLASGSHEGTQGVAYNSTTMRWWKIKETAGDLLFQTSADGSTWTTRRTMADHGYTLTGMSILLGAHRDGGSDGTYCRFDNLNNPPS